MHDEYFELLVGTWMADHDGLLAGAVTLELLYHRKQHASVVLDLGRPESQEKDALEYPYRGTGNTIILI